ncbi:MAG: prolipoprotein diacylglyceryl transferase [Saprospiraceae bacterium]|nr:prolipoprotein diacylglyceryl transferase [Saprospiraceae bacterium]
MYPDLSYILHALFGTSPDNAFSIVKTFGLLLSLAVFCSGWMLYYELIRKEAAGQITGRIESVVVYKPVDWTEILTQTLINFIIGYKFGLMFEDFASFQLDPAAAVFSTKGYLPGGLILAGITFAWWWYKMNKQTDHEIRKKEMLVRPVDRIFDITALAALSGIIGSKLFSIFENFGDFIRDPIGSFFSGSGLTIYGGLILAFLVVYRYIHSKGLRPIHMMDAIAPTLMIGYAVGRMGCHLSGDGDWGIVNEMAKPGWFVFPDSWWAFGYPHNVINEGLPIEGCSWRHCMQLVPKVFPTPLYESILAFMITGILWMLRKKIKFAGVLFFIYCILNGIERFFIEAIRVNPRYDILGFHPSLSQFIALLLIFVGITGTVYYWKKKII